MKILVLLDGSKWSYKAAINAIEIAKKKDAEITIFSVIDKDETRAAAFYLCRQSNMCDLVNEHEDKIYRDLKKSIGEDLNELTLNMNRMNLEGRSKIVEGRRDEEILKEFESGDYSLVVMGAFGKRSNIRVGTLFNGISTAINVPILIIR
ncbi:MAG: universal stress protein [Methanomicrobiaceae archaeon]|nr:universal stress protein [Methanomicrobiaceae archaeon]